MANLDYDMEFINITFDVDTSVQDELRAAVVAAGSRYVNQFDYSMVHVTVSIDYEYPIIQVYVGADEDIDVFELSHIDFPALWKKLVIQAFMCQKELGEIQID